ncbi:MAG: ABC transporter ATP-binding protein [Clostridiales bacterium]|jgi:ATP-binding cassette subfamily B multidrug efflux pump|nr:ABC transporter ATP-binding protein [Clostridiales bacterium]OPZ67314.1 MAG: putative ABC transporter ATP-binding protein [Firmicutes bacterium ADurb.Bin467]
MLKIFKHLRRREWEFMLASVAFIVAQVWLDLKLPEYMNAITRLVNTPGSAIADIWRAGGKMLLCALGSVLAAFCVGFLAARIAASFSRNLRGELFDRVESFSMAEISQFSTASLITRSTNDVQQVQMIVAMGLQVIIKAPITAVWAVTKISTKSWQWTAATAAAVGVMLLIISVAVIFVLPRFKRIQVLTDNLNRVTRENLTGVRVVRAYNAEKYQQKKFEQASDELTRNNLIATRIMSVMGPGMQMIMSGMSLSIYWIGAHLINAAALTAKIGLFSDMVVFMNYSMQVVMSFMMLTIVFIMLPRAAVSAKRINEVLDTRPTILDGQAAAGKPGLVGTVEFKNVCFRYPDATEPVLEGVSFTANRGEVVAFIGSTGSGKSTVVNLVPRFYDATEGEVLVDGVNVRDYSLDALRNKLGYVPQSAVLFSGTIASNVGYGDSGKPAPTLDEIRRAVAIAQGTEFVEKMPEKYDAPIARGGTNVSGGQKQRLSIARAVARNPEIYIFDDAFSALDYRTDRALRSALKRETNGATCLIVAQRIGTIRDADKIVVLNEGRVAGIGTHAELLKSCEVYREIAHSQLSEEELKHA